MHHLKIETKIDIGILIPQLVQHKEYKTPGTALIIRTIQTPRKRRNKKNTRNRLKGEQKSRFKTDLGNTCSGLYRAKAKLILSAAGKSVGKTTPRIMILLIDGAFVEHGRFVNVHPPDRQFQFLSIFKLTSIIFPPSHIGKTKGSCGQSSF